MSFDINKFGGPGWWMQSRRDAWADLVQPDLPNLLPGGVLTGGSRGTETWLKTHYTLITAAQLLALRATPIQISVDIANANQMLVFERAVLFYNAGTTGYTVQGDEDLIIEYESGQDTSVAILADNDTGRIDFTGTTDRALLVPASVAAGIAPTIVITNEMLQLKQVGAGEWDLGNGTLEVWCTYWHYEFA
jgi:hypothetical protein